MTRTIIVWLLFGLAFVNLTCIVLVLWQHHRAFMQHLRENHRRCLDRFFSETRQ